MNYVYVGLACFVAGIFLRPVIAGLFKKAGSGLGAQ